MFAARYFAERYFPARYFQSGGDGEPVAPPVVGARSGGGRIYPYPREEKKRKKVERQPLPEYEVSGPLSRQTAIEHPMLPDWDQEAWEASLKTLAHLEKEQKVRRQKTVESALLLWMAA